MDSVDVVEAFKTLQRKYKGWSEPLVTATQKAQSEAHEQIFEGMRVGSVEALVSKNNSSQYGVDDQLAAVVACLRDFRKQLDAASAVRSAYEEKYALVKEAGVAAEAQAILQQKHLQKISELHSAHSAEVAEVEADFALKQKGFEESERKLIEDYERQRVKVNAQRVRDENEYEYKQKVELQRIQDAQDEEDLKQQSHIEKLTAVRTKERAVVKADLAKKEEALPDKLEKISELKRRIEEEVPAKQKQAYDQQYKDRHDAHDVLLQFQQSSIAVRKHEIQSLNDSLRGQEAEIDGLKAQISEVLAHHNSLATLVLQKKETGQA